MRKKISENYYPFPNVELSSEVTKKPCSTDFYDPHEIPMELIRSWSGWRIEQLGPRFGIIPYSEIIAK